MHIAIIGGSGLIGSETARQFAEAGHDVTLLSRRPSKDEQGAPWVQCDIANAAEVHAALDSIRPAAVVHLAALLQFSCDQQPAEAIRMNVDGTVNVLEACRTLGIRRIVFGSSMAAYGRRTDRMFETDPIPDDVGLYGQTKRLCEVLGGRYRTLYGIEFVALRYAGVIGPHELHSAGMAMVRQQIRSTASGVDVTIEDASGNETVHLTHVSDAAAATVAAALRANPQHTVYNVAGPADNYMTLKQYHATVRELVPHAGNVCWAGSARGAGPLDLTRLETDLGVSPQVSVRDALKLDLQTLGLL
jgi:UDP-glucose 4-epimerase